MVWFTAERSKRAKTCTARSPITRWIAQTASKIRNAVRRYGCVFQTGTQQRSDPKFRHACELARNGYLGHAQHDLCRRAWWTLLSGRTAVQSARRAFDYDLWTGPAPYIPFDKRRCEWLAMYMISHYCAGFITNWGVHHLDIAGWGCPEVFQRAFEIVGTGVLPSEGMTDTWVSWQTELRWESGLKMSYTNSDNPNKQGCKFEGDEGWVHVNRRGIWAEPASLLDVKLTADDNPLHTSPEHGDPYTAHTADLFRSMRTRQDPVFTCRTRARRKHAW
jgi:predicted dehydrogenase